MPGIQLRNECPGLRSMTARFDVATQLLTKAKIQDKEERMDFDRWAMWIRKRPFENLLNREQRYS